MTEYVYGPFKRTSGFSAEFCLTWNGEILPDFHSKILWGPLFLALEAWVGKPSKVRGPLTLKGGPPPLRYLLPMGVGQAHFSSLPLLTVSSWPLLYICSYRRYVQLVFR